MPVNEPAALLERLLTEPTETTWLEFKENDNDAMRIGKWISACANAAILAEKKRAFLVYGIENGTHRKVGTTVRLNAMKGRGNENFINWINRKIEPNLMMEFLDFEYEGVPYAILVVEPTYDRPVRFDKIEYIHIGENIKELKDHPTYERALWMATGRRKFEDAIALPHQSAMQVLEKLDTETYYALSRDETKPQNDAEVLRALAHAGLTVDDMEGGFDITNLGAILLARDITMFPSIATKSVRVIKYLGNDKRASEDEVEGRKGYAVGFAGLLKYVVKAVPAVEQYTNGIRAKVPVHSEIAIREVIANALIHQDFTVSGAGPVIELYSDRIEVYSPGNSLIEVDRLINERRSRNERLASVMRGFGLCEERGGGLDKALIEIEEKKLPALEFESSRDSMRVTLPGPKAFNKLSKEEKLWACFLHCALQWAKKDPMSNTTLRERFGLPQEEYQAASALISESLKRGRIKPLDPDQGNRNARYVPYWAR